MAGTLVVVGVAVLTAALMPPVVYTLRRWGVYDEPSQRSSHRVKTPRGGGLAPLLSVGALAIMSLQVNMPLSVAPVWAAVYFGLLGVGEDWRGIGVRKRICVQLTLALVIIFPIAPPQGSGSFGAGLAALASIVWLTGYVNAFNFMDGVNGLAAFQSLIAGLSLTLMFSRIGESELAVASAVVAGAALGFLPFNFPKARVFLGDSGSYLLGSYIAVLILLGVLTGLPVGAALAPVVLYIADTGVTLLRRIVRGELWYVPHREHTYQRLARLGWSHTHIAAFCAALMVVTSALGFTQLVSVLWIKWLGIAGLVAVAAGYLLVPNVYGRPKALPVDGV
jgi:UDP-N-acetylmuramyl pentapeptide phosphotransferase/UDP-N-acetylglucosamine-1-phosphate transferase